MPSTPATAMCSRLWRADQKEAVFQVSEGEASREEVIPYDLLHVTPPMGPPLWWWPTCWPT
ncbi:hypothetical protein KBY65_11330 [Cyanobium sp. Alchichica 3B3-8F6]|nr:hypothetical protein [Cyanobium sp. Alchichica 3B3-8F6]MCP9943328.1 hypothetical protein [Cyanobium sp. ATX 6E8]